MEVLAGVFLSLKIQGRLPQVPHSIDFEKPTAFSKTCKSPGDLSSGLPLVLILCFHKLVQHRAHLAVVRFSHFLIVYKLTLTHLCVYGSLYFLLRIQDLYHKISDKVH